jgi:hypothetical protein
MIKMKMSTEYPTFQDFYPYYLAEHRHPVCRRLHFIGSLLVLITALYIVLTGAWNLIWSLPFLGYGFAWLGHFFFEKNKPATFTYPLYSLIGDWAMFKDILTGKIKF